MPNKITTSHSFSYIWKNYKNLFTNIDIASLVMFRISFGIIMLVEVYRYFKKGWIARYWIEAEYNFPFYPFNFEPLNGNGMYVLFGLLGALAFFILIGFLYRISTVLFFFGFTYMYLLEQTRYLNHFYLICLLSFVLIFLPAHKSASVDSKIFKSIKSEHQPLWSLWLLRFMIGIPFFFGGIAKINPDWLVGQPLGIWLANDTDFPIIGQFFTEHWMILLISYSGLFLDLLLVFFLLNKKTRIYAFLAGFLFHVMNANLFTIGIFPWFMILATTIFFNPSWPRNVINFLFGRNSWLKNKIEQYSIIKLSKQQQFTLLLLSFWSLIMVLIPFRHFLIPGNVSWTEEGHNYSWHMKLRTKRAKGYFIVSNKEKTLNDTIDVRDYAERWQSRKVIARPKLVWQFANYLKEDYKLLGYDNIEVYANIKAKLNGRKYQQFINPEVDLTSVPYPFFKKATWIVPLNN